MQCRPSASFSARLPKRNYLGKAEVIGILSLK
jgi:hypothetical protein